MSTLVFRTLNPSDAEAVKRLRLEALTGKDSRYFIVSSEDETLRSLEEWKDYCTETTENAVFGAFSDGKIVGMCIAQQWGEAANKIARWGSAYTEPASRRKGILKDMTRLREQWTIDHGFRKAFLTIRHDNIPSLEIHKSLGAKIIGAENMRFTDGSTAKTFWLERHFEYASARIEKIDLLEQRLGG